MRAPAGMCVGQIAPQRGAAAPNRHAVFRVLGPTGAVVKDYSLVSSTLDRTEMVGFMVGVAPKSHRKFAYVFDQFKGRCTFLFADHVTQNSAE